ncbi:MAG: Uma2 family endonuclease [Ilumatobacteraceae bacterium]
MMVQTSTDEAPELLDLIEHRRANGLDTYDEWWDGVYRIVTGPSPEHGTLILDLGMLLMRRARDRGMLAAAPVNVGVDKYDAKVPDIGIFLPDTDRHSPAFLVTAAMVVEILSPSERAGEKLPFYARVGVREYLEVHLAAGTCRLLENRDGSWEPVEHSSVIDLRVTEIAELL